MMCNRPNTSLLVVIFVCCISALSSVASAQVASPSNIQNANVGGNGNSEQSASSKECHVTDFELPQELLAGTPPGFQSTTFGLVVAIQAGWVPALGLYETPIAVRFTRLIDALDWNCAAVYSQKWDDALTKTEPIIRTPTTAKNVDASSGLFVQERDVSLHTSDTRFLCAVHGWHAIIQDWVPDALGTLLPALAGLGLNFTEESLGYNEDVGECFVDVANGGPIDAICLERIAKDHCYKPAIMGQIVGRQLAEYARTDGWNQDGKLNKDGSPCTANCRRFTDTTSYYPVHHPGGTTNKDRWMPLLEDDMRGYETRQEHVTPHIGTEAKTAALTRDEINAKVAVPPGYDLSNYDQEAEAVIQRLLETAQSDEKKMKIEFYDNKLNVAVAVIGAVAFQFQLLYEEVLNFALALTAGDYDAIILAWKEKIHYDLVRPTTWIQEMMGDMDIETYAGPFQGVQTIKGKNFESYVRVMPHSEYVSGSACICQALMELTDQWIVLNRVGEDPATLNITFPTFIAGSSKTEPGITPAQDLDIVVNGMNELRLQCGESRLDGGMHFAESVQNSYTLCNGVGIAAADFAFSVSDSGNF